MASYDVFLVLLKTEESTKIKNDSDRYLPLLDSLLTFTIPHRRNFPKEVRSKQDTVNMRFNQLV